MKNPELPLLGNSGCLMFLLRKCHCERSVAGEVKNYTLSYQSSFEY